MVNTKQLVSESMGYIIIKGHYAVAVKAICIGDSPCDRDPELVVGCGVRAAG